MRSAGALVAALLAVAACKGSGAPPVAPAAPPPPVSAGTPVALPDGGIHHTERLAWVGWASDGRFGACGRRTSDFTVAGALRGCVVVDAPGAAPRQLDWTADPAFVRDTRAVDAAPGPCRILLDDVPGDPGAPPARATLLAPAGATPLDRWAPARTVDGDYFAIEASLSPDGRWLALLHVAVGLGDDRTVDVSAVELRPAPACPAVDSRPPPGRK